MPADFPTWLVDVAERVAELVKTPGNRRIFETRTVAAVAQLRKRTRAIDDDDSPWTDVLDLRLRGMSLDEQYAWLAVIHDRVLPHRKPIIPRIGARGAKLVSSPAARAKFKALAPLLVLKSSVTELRPRHRSQLVAALRSVWVEMTGQALPSNAVRQAPKPTRVRAEVEGVAGQGPVTDAKPAQATDRQKAGGKGKSGPNKKGSRRPRETPTVPMMNAYRLVKESGATYRGAAKVLGVSKSTVGNWVKFVGCSLKSQRSVRTSKLPEDRRGNPLVEG